MVKIEFDMNMKLPNDRTRHEPRIKMPFMGEETNHNYGKSLFDEVDDEYHHEERITNLDKEMEREIHQPMDIGMGVGMDMMTVDKNNKLNEDLAKRDQHLLKIEDEIELRRKFLLDKQKRLDKLTRQNHFLETIKQDYETYHGYIVEQKESQIRAMNSIKQYVEDLIVSGKLTDEDIRKAKDDQREITGEVKKIREKIN